MLEIKDLCKRYADKQALDHVSLTVGPGEIVGLFGENGAGKTTLMKCILSLIRYDSGSGRRGHHAREYRPVLLRHLRAQLLPRPFGPGAPGIL